MRPVMLAALGLVMAAGPAFAHHPFASEFDAKAPITLTGTVMRVDWNDPHVMIHVVVKDAAGQTRDWSMEAASPNGMKSKGWTQAMLKQGEQITVQGYRAKSEPFVMTARMIELPGGQKMSSAANDGGPQT
jgi:uncharacterized protein DUF6152